MSRAHLDCMGHSETQVNPLYTKYYSNILLKTNVAGKEQALRLNSLPDRLQRLNANLNTVNMISPKFMKKIVMCPAMRPSVSSSSRCVWWSAIRPSIRLKITAFLPWRFHMRELASSSDIKIDTRNQAHTALTAMPKAVTTA